MTAPLLALEDLRVRFGGVAAVDGASLTLEHGTFTGLIGPNGAGKTTLLRLIIGIVRADNGRIRLDGRDITKLAVSRRARLGLAMSHQIVRPFRSLSVLDNVALAAGRRRTRDPLLSLLHVKRSTERARARELLDLVGIGDAADAEPAKLPLGYLKRLEMARALALEPRLLLLDEPLAGLNHSEAHRLADTIAGIHQTGTTVLLIEHNLAEVMRVCRRLVVLDQGRVIAEGEPRAVMADPKVRAAYLGEAPHAAA
ncbi:ABC transporter ATP-binding protein [Rhodospirillaceae bacterium SYSU D60014]|uniref:ABC transporter ATP-binding protein n=1 Tax=Virgifigura deserti TaxID=2268457 RepID=UPI000E66C515